MGILRPLITGLLACSVFYASALSLTIWTTGAHCPAFLDGTAIANATGGTPPYAYLWNTGATTQQIAGLVPGFYNCTVTDAMGTTAFSQSQVQEAAQYMNTESRMYKRLALAVAAE